MPTVRDGMTGSYNQTVGVKLDIDEAIVILPVWDVPLQRMVGSVPATQTKVSWLEEDLTPQTITVTSVTGTASPWTLTIPDGTTEVVRPGDILQLTNVDDYGRQFRVDSVNHTTNQVVVSSFGATTDSDDPASGDVLQIIGQYRDEGSDPEAARSVEREEKYNFTQWGQERIQVTRTARKRELYGQGDPYDHEVMKKFRELAIRFERSMVLGYRVESTDKKRRSMGGLLFYITTNAVSNTAANVKTAINQLVRKAYEQGGSPSVLMVSPAVKAAISANIDPTLRRSDRADRIGGFVVDSVLTDFGEVDVVANRHFPTKKGILLQREFIKRRPFDNYFHELLAKTGDADVGHIVGEQSLEVKNEKAHGVLTVTDAA